MLNIINSTSKVNFLFFIIHIFLQIKSIINQCSNGYCITSKDCFNNLIEIKKYYRAAQFATNKEGNMIIEYSNDHSGMHQYRLFYGLKKNGRNYFENDNAHKIFQIETTESHKGRYEARNMFVYLQDDINRDKQYLFSTSSYDTITELHDIEQGSYKVKGTLSFWNIIDIFSYQYSIIELKQNNKNIYFLIFTQHEEDQIQVGDKWKDYSMTITIKKFAFNSYDLENYNKISTKNFTDNYNNRIVSSFLVESKNILVLFYMKTMETVQKVFNGAKYAIKFYDYDLNEKNEIIISQNNITQPRSGEGVFFKGLYLKDNYAAFIYYTKGYDDTIIQFNISTLEENSGKYYFNNKIQFNRTYGYRSDITLNEFIKINDEQLAFISTKKITSGDSYYFELHILLYDLYNNYANMKIRQYYYNLVNIQPIKELTAYVYNGFLIFSTTAVSPVNYTSSDYYSILAFFGYPNGTDYTLDISPYLMDTGFYSDDNNIYTELMSKMKIENNIFGYEKVEKINLVSIPAELIFYNITDGVQDSIPLPNNTFFDSNHKLYQNWQLNKTDKYYYIDYQYIVKEPNYNTFYSTGSLADYITSYDGSSYYEQNRKTFYGRTNRLKFKLCYDFCGTCVEISKDINDQKCFTCLENYTYDYWAYMGKYIGNCVEENKYFDYGNTNQMISCDSSFKYLINKDNGKRICFKEDKECPYDYSTYNSETKECIYTPRTTQILEPTTIPIITTEVIKTTTIPIDSTSTQICDFDSYYNKDCTFSNESFSQILDKMKGLISSYSNNSLILSVPLSEGYAFEITNEKKERLLNNDTNLPWIDLAKCGDKLKAHYRNNSNVSLIILKYGKISDKTFEEEVQFEVYDPVTYEKLNLSICNNSDINLIINLPLSDKFVNILKNIIDQGYDPYDINDKFYREICTPYDSENGTDVLLDSREEYYYSSLNTIVCPDHCHTSTYDLESKYLKCECAVNETDITLNLKHITGENIGNSFYSTLKNSNWKVMICYNLVFNWKIFRHNSGSIISLVFFLIYVGFFVYFVFRGTEPLRLVISKIMFKDMKLEEDLDKKDIVINENVNSAKITKKNRLKNKNKEKRVKIKNPPKKEKSRKINSTVNGAKESDNTKAVSFTESKNLKGEKLMTTPGKSRKDNIRQKFRKELVYTEGANLKKTGDTTKRKEEEIILNLDNFELNNLEYLDACKLDERPFIKVYWSVLLREHLVLFTFFSWNDYNLFYVKIERFLVLICTQMTMNGLFFSDESMHKANKQDDYNFVQQLPKIIFSLIATHLIEVVLCYFSMTDTTIYKIKELAKNKQNEKIIFDEIKCMKRKIIAFYVITFLLFLFYWYFISAFCAVYQNTQKTFLLDSLISILVEFIDPFFIYCFTTLLRHLSLAKCANQKMECVYKTSDLIPIF